MAVKERYQQALEHAKSGEYQAALNILKTIDHPKARELESKIRAHLPAAPKAPNYRRYTKPILLILIAVLVFVGVQWYSQMKFMVDDSNIRFHLKETCEFQAILNKTDAAQCPAWIDDVMANYQQAAMDCLSESNPQICLELGLKGDLPPFPGE